MIKEFNIDVPMDLSAVRLHQYIKWMSILDKYKDYEVVTVGGESKDVLLRDSLKHIAYAMSKATYHVGVDSGFLHMSQVYFSPENIHIYTLSPKDRWSHHMHRAKDNGIKINDGIN